MFDDVLDLSLVEVCGLRLFIPRKTNPLFNDFVLKHKLADYATGGTCGQYAVREASELLMGLMGNFDKTITERMAYSDEYAAYLALRKATIPMYYTTQDGEVVEVKGN